MIIEGNQPIVNCAYACQKLKIMDDIWNVRWSEKMIEEREVLDVK